MSLKAIAEETLARLRAGETAHETKKETEMKQVKQPVSCFTGGSAGFTPMKHAEPRKTAKNGACFTVSFPRGETRETSLPADLVASLDRLQTTRPPRITRPEIWLAVVAKCAPLGLRGLGGSSSPPRLVTARPMGLLSTRGGNSDHDGLAVWIDGRRVLLLDADTCIVETGPNERSVFNRRPSAGAVFLWDLGEEVRRG